MEEEYDPRNPMPELKENAVAEYFAVESKYMTSPDYRESNKRFLRRRALQLVFINSKSEDFDPVVPYLAMNYYDRFITSNPLPVVDNDLRSSFDLLVICCLTLAWKMREQTFSLPDFLSKRNLPQINDANVPEMESRIRDGLGGLMNAVTPFCFVDYLLSKVEAPIGLRLIDDVILEAQARVEFSQFKPSVIAGAAIVMAALIRHTQEFPATQRSFYAEDKLMRSRKTKQLSDTFGERRELDGCFRYVTALYSDHKIGSEDEAFMALSSNKQQQERTSVVGKKKKSSRSSKEQQTPREKGKGVLEAIKEETGDEMYTELKWLTEREEIHEVTNDPNLLLQFVAPPPPPAAGDHQENA